MIVESKKRAHHLYEILRSEGFRNDMGNIMSIVQYLLKVSEKNITDPHCENAKQETPSAIAIHESQYLIAKELFSDNSISELKLYMSDDHKIDYETKRENFLFFQKILSQKGINGSAAISNVIKSQRTHYIEYMIDNNGKFGWYFTSWEIWYAICLESDYQTMKLVNNKSQNMVVSSSNNNNDDKNKPAAQKKIQNIGYYLH